MVRPLADRPARLPATLAPSAATPPAPVPGLPSAGQLVGMQVVATVVGIAGGVSAFFLAQNAGWQGASPLFLGAAVALGCNLLPGIGLLTVQLGRRLIGLGCAHDHGSR